MLFFQTIDRLAAHLQNHLPREAKVKIQNIAIEYVKCQVCFVSCPLNSNSVFVVVIFALTEKGSWDVFSAFFKIQAIKISVSEELRTLPIF